MVPDRMATKRDYYDLLGVDRGAGDKEIKAAYRRLARKYHPDVNRDDPKAEERFKEISEAFAVLSDPEKRAKYDRGGHEAFGPDFDPFAGAGFDFRSAGLGDLGDLFEMFTGGGQRGPRRAQRGQDLQLEMRLPFADAVRGTTVTVQIPRQETCAVCRGSGVRPGGGETTCPDCRGTGRESRGRAGMRVSLTCRRCGGAGKLRGDPCSACRGTGLTRKEERVRVRIPPGIEDGGRVRVPGKGDSGGGGGASGDAFLVIRVEPDPRFRREGRDLVCEVTVGLARAALGGTVQVPTLDGAATVTLPAGTRSGQRLRLRGRGVPAHRGRPAGDLHAIVQIEPPRKLDDRSRELLEEFARLNPVP